MNGIHEVTGSIPVWSTNLRSVIHAKVVHRSAKREGGPPLHDWFGASVGEPPRCMVHAKVAGDIFELLTVLKAQSLQLSTAMRRESRSILTL